MAGREGNPPAETIFACGDHRHGVVIDVVGYRGVFGLNPGSTSLDNLVLLCSNHHHVIHQNPWQLKPDLDHPGRWIFISPAGAQTPGNIHHQKPEPEPVDKPKIEPKPVTPKPRAREPVP